MYTATRGRWTWQPYLLVVESPSNAALRYARMERAHGVVLLSTYAINRAWSMGARVEYTGNHSPMGDPGLNADLLGYGAGSRAWTFTLTPTYRHKHFLLRSDLSSVIVRGAAPGAAFGPDGARLAQSRVAVESGISF